ncbi:LON peptidase substrate-binding domain-containing protein [Actinoplanes sp. NEAU-A12]|uniref:LON peptidase substrate-binding domain-containing protein n=1 Tax=Actinoplanes sandaracinus TaxID=3045177 RepID=A0ABT6WXN6_9ACTN|nr:LON peptidase substrate-binding domain-containing protein [Actinoplanes sandaracinus]MDI6104499.1 LON peptidase substrate-binding domain-containing protein [Actinoplanes sandaracinus]
MSDRLPVFPLSTVLFPGLVLPLHIFEERYRTLVRELVARSESAPHEFGVVTLRHGSEVAPDPGEDGAVPQPPVGAADLYEVGCTAELRHVTELPDGRFDIMTVGRRRFTVLSVEQGAEPYLTASVRWLAEEDEPSETAQLLAPRVLTAFRTYLELLRPNSEVLDQVPDDPTVLSHLVAATAQLTVEERQMLLAMPDTAGRLRAELRLLNREAGLLARVRAVPVPLSDLARPASPN